MANSIVPFSNGKNLTDGIVLPSKRKASELVAARNHGEEEEDGTIANQIRKEIKSVVKDYIDLKFKVKDYVAKTHSSSADAILDESPYPEVPGLPDTYHTFHLGHGGLPEWKREGAIAAAKKYHAVQQSNFLGYQINFNLNYERDFGSYLNSHVNNIGDAFKEGNLTVNSKFMERAVLDYYAELWNIKWPHSDTDLESYWGFCLTMGSTEGNLYGMWNGRDYLSGKKILVDDRLVRRRGGAMVKVPRLVYQKSVLNPGQSKNAYTPIAFFSEDTHYSLSKAMTMLEITTFYAKGHEEYPGECPITDDGEWPAEVPSFDTGAINVESLATLVEFFASRGYPILVCFNYGTTFKGAYDDVALACEKLKPILAKHHLLEREVKYDDNGETKVDIRTGYWFHVDGALGAAYMPYIEMAHHAGRIRKKGPCFDFRLPMVHSIAMSGHKWIGASVPCGVYMTRTKYQMMPPDIPEYIGTPDTTFAGSRNGLSPMLLWDNIARHSYEDQIQKSLDLEELAAYTERRLRHLQNEVLQKDLYVERTPLALTVHFKRANDELCKKYSLSNEDLDGRRYSHVFLMEHVTYELVDAFIEDLSQEGAFPDDVETKSFTLDAGLRAPTYNRIALVPSEGRGFHG